MALVGMGEQSLIAAPMTAFFASRQCPGAAIRAAMDWAMQQAKTRQPVISGFHSSLEQSVLQLLLQARNPVVVVLARPVTGAKLSPDWKTAIAEGRMVVVSATTEAERLTEEQATERNEVVARLAERIVLAHASAEGGLALQSKVWIKEGLRVSMLTEAGWHAPG